MKRWLLFLFVTMFISCVASAGNLTLLPIFSDNMVVQRNTDVPIWGNANPGESVTVEFSGQKKSEIADKNGKWMIKLSPMKENPAPQNLTISTKDQTLTIKNVLVGDVWLCSGQSNMVYGFGASKRPADFKTDYPLIREFTVPRSFSVTKEDSFKTAPVDIGHKFSLKKSWTPCTKSSAGGLSATALFFAIEIYKEIKIPLGIINCSFNGSAARFWIPSEILKKNPMYDKIFKKAEKDLKLFYVNLPIYKRDQALFDNMNSELKKNRDVKSDYKDPGNTGLAKGWAAFEVDESKWKRIPWGWPYFRPNHVWDGDSVLWVRFICVARKGTGDIHLDGGLFTGAKVEYFFDGKKLEPTKKKALDGQQQFVFPRTLELEKHRNRGVLALRIVSTAPLVSAIRWPRSRDMYVNPFLYRVETAKKGADFRLYGCKYPPKGLGLYPGSRFNAMLNPIIPYAITGYLWYQGESDCMQGLESSKRYAKTLPLLIETWRNIWGGKPKPFIVVQLASLIANRKAFLMELRESQKAALKLPNTALSPSMDIREPHNWHPRNKYDIGTRAGKAALKIAYNKNITASGPMYKSMKIEGNKARISFDHIGSGLVVGEKKDLEPVKILDQKEVPHFLIAGKEMKFVPAKAIIDGDTVVVWNDKISTPVAVRYAWINMPANPLLYNKEGLPACSFRTDEHIH